RPHVDQRIAGDDAALHRLLDAGVDRGDVLARDHAAGDLVDELVATARAGRLEADDDVAVLTATTRLADVALFDLLDGLRDRLAVRDLRLADVRGDRELAHHAVDEHVEVQLAHAGDDRLARVVVGADLERRVLLRQRAEGLAELVLVGLRLRLDRDRDHRLRELHLLEQDRVTGLAQRVAGARGLQSDGRDDVTSEHAFLVLAVVRVHLEDAPDALLLVLRDVEQLAAGGELARVDAEVRELPDVRVAHDLERERGERLAVVGVTLDRLAGLDVGAFDRRDVDGARQVVDDRVEQRLHTLVLERGAAQHRHHSTLDGRRAQAAPKVLGGDLLFADVLLEHGLVVVADDIDELVTPVLGVGLELR